MNNHVGTFSIFPSATSPANHPRNGSPSVSTLGQVGLIKSQRDGLGFELKAQQAANAEAKQSVSSLRKLAFRLAVRISVKEAKVAQSARSLAQSRASSYLNIREHSSRITELQATLVRHQDRNREVTERLEHAALLAKQCKKLVEDDHLPNVIGNPGHSSGRQQLAPSHTAHHRKRPISPPLSSGSISPPPTPPRRISSLKRRSQKCEPSNIIADLTGIHSASERLLMEKRGSDNALVICQSQIETLQDEYEQSQNKLRDLESSKATLEDTLFEYKTRAGELAASKCCLERDLQFTQSKLAQMTESEDKLRARMHAKEARINILERVYQHSEKKVAELEKSRTSLDEDLAWCKEQTKASETERLSLQQDLAHIRGQLASAEESQRSLEVKLGAANDQVVRLKEKLEMSHASSKRFQRKAECFENETSELASRIEVSAGWLGHLEKQLHAAEQSKSSVQEDLETIRRARKESEENLCTIMHDKEGLQAQLHVVEQSRSNLKAELSDLHDRLKFSQDSEREIKSQVQELLKAREDLQEQLCTALEKLRLEQKKGPETAAELQSLRERKAEVEGNLRQTQEAAAGLQAHLESTQLKLTSAEKSKDELQIKYETSRNANAALAEDVNNVNLAKAHIDSALEAALKSKATLEAHFRANKTRLIIAESDSVNLHAALSAAEQEVEALHRTVEGTKKSERHLRARVAVTEEELFAVQQANEELETFLAEAKEGIGHAAESTAAVETNFENHSSESAVKLSAAEKAKADCRKKLETTEKQMLELQESNRNLEIDVERRNHEINELRGEEEQLNEEIRGKDECINDLQKTKSGFSESISSMEYELRILRETKETFGQVVERLREKGEHLDILNEWCAEPLPQAADHEKPLPAAPPLEEETDVVSSSAHPHSSHTTRSSEGSELDAWAIEVERARMLRNEIAAQLKGLKSSKSALKRDLKVREAELHRLEHQHSKHKHHFFHVGFSRSIRGSSSKNGIASTSKLNPSHMSIATHSSIPEKDDSDAPVGRSNPERHTWAGATTFTLSANAASSHTSIASGTPLPSASDLARHSSTAQSDSPSATKSQHHHLHHLHFGLGRPGSSGSHGSSAAFSSDEIGTHGSRRSWTGNVLRGKLHRQVNEDGPL
ncbi:hypothetical protein K490DRAFT_62903 [Saccharata proteae CBS 121410]|uniref:Uncharacterized protein n=1 Tax=Saccharata proteae CBS 121410 TaxID=1314787 RepID=A0A9P4HY94_9PEZI|nr:hypothetical protein K490DRAFT_62903 [Saccharata proteae CBS 121410]